MRSIQTVCADMRRNCRQKRWNERSRNVSEGIPANFGENRAEAKRMSIYEYDQEKHLRQEREASWEKEEGGSCE